MADNPLQDNTQAQEKATEQGREQLRATQELTRALEQAARAIPPASPRPTYVAPPPRPTQAAPPVRPTQIAPPFHAGFPDVTGNAVETAALGRQYQLNQQLSQQWAQRMANLGGASPPPPPPSNASPSPPSPTPAGAAPGKSFDDYLREIMARQQAQSPVAQQAEQVQQQEIQRREKLNRELGTSTSALYRFTEGMARGNPIGGAASALGGLGPVGGLLGTAISSLAGLLTTLENERLTGIHRGGAALSPSGAQTETMSVQLREMAEAQQTGELGRQTEQARMEQLRRQARKMGMTEEGDPRGTFQRLMRSQEEIIRRYEDLFQGHSAPERSARQAGRVSARYEEFIRSQGGTPEAMKFDIPNLAQPGYTTARRYHEELQVGALQREDLSNEKFKEQTAILRQMGLLLEGIKENTNGLENLRPRWS